MAERTFSALSAAQPTTAAPVAISLSASALKVIQQIHAPYDGPPLRITEWGCAFNSPTPGTGMALELVEVNVGATSGTAYNVPYTRLNTAISSSGTTTIVPFSNAGFPGSGNYLAQAMTEIFEVTAGQGSNSWTVVRGVNGGALSAIPTQTPIVGVGCPPGDIIPDNTTGLLVPSRIAAQQYFDVLNSLPVSGFGFSTQGSPTVVRELTAPIVSPTGSYVAQQPLGREPEVTPGNFAQIRVTTASGETPGVVSWIKWAE